MGARNVQGPRQQRLARQHAGAKPGPWAAEENSFQVLATSPAGLALAQIQQPPASPKAGPAPSAQGRLQMPSISSSWIVAAETPCSHPKPATAIVEACLVSSPHTFLTLSHP